MAKKRGVTARAASDGKLGTFLGVFTPSILTILGVIMFLRFGWVVGHAGLLNALVIVGVANVITLVTTLSLSAVATNMRVGVGGAYYIISRSLGIELGGAIGLPLFLAQALSVTLYSFGLAESLRFVFTELTPQQVQIIAAGIVVAVTLLSIKSARFALSAQIPVMILIGLALMSLLIGGVFKGAKEPVLGLGAGSGLGFWTVFAVFFPAVTGIMAGLSLSGDLRTPQRAIPVGTVAAVLVGFVVYMAVPVVLAFNADRDALVGDSLVWTRVAIVGWIILPGLWGAILSSAVGSILGAPRTLQALATDKVVPGVFARGRGSGPPVAAIVVSAGIALGAVLLGDLNAVAPVLTMFFLTTYGMVNLVAGLETLVGEPSYRPKVHVPWMLSFAGALACFFVMFLINRIACAVAIVVEIALWAWLRRRSMAGTWGDVRRGFWLGVARLALVNVKSLPDEPRNWRPNILVFSGDIWKRIELVRFACQLSQDRGIVTACTLIEGDLEGNGDFDIDAKQAEISAALDGYGLTVFSNVSVVRSFETGVIDLAQSHGIAGLDSNTLMFGWSDNPERVTSYLRIMRQATRLRKSMIICRLAGLPVEKKPKQIDIWWRGKQRNGDMMLLLAYLLSLNPEWHGARIAVKSVAVSEMARDETERNLAAMIPEARIPASTKVILKPEDRTVLEIMHEESRDADVIFMGLAEPEPGEEAAYAERLAEMIEGFPTVVLVKNSSMFVGELV